MSFDRIDVNRRAYPASTSVRPAATPQLDESDDLIDFPDGDSIREFSGRAMVPVAAASQSVARQWADKAMMWGVQEGAADVVNTATAPKGRLGSHVSRLKQSVHSKFSGKAQSASQQATQSTAPLPKTYSNLLHLGSEQVSLKDANWSKLKGAAQSNIQPFKDALASKESFFKDVTPKSYIKDTVIKNNLKPIKDLATNNPDAKLGTSLLRTAGIGLMGYDVVRNTYDAYKDAKSKEDGSWRSKVNTVAKTGVAFGKYAVRNVSTWEAAGVGAAVGKALIPLALGGVPLGGIAVGALAGLAAQKGLDRILKTGHKDPVQQEKAQRKQAEKEAKAQQKNPFGHAQHA